MSGLIYGENTEEVQKFIDWMATATDEEMRTIYDDHEKRDREVHAHAYANAYVHVYSCTSAHASYTIAYTSACSALNYAGYALCVRRLITTEDFEILTAPVRFVLERLGVVKSFEFTK